MLFKLFLGFTLIPVTEIYLLISVGSQIGTLKTIVIVVLTGIVGAYLAQSQGLKTLFKMREQMQKGVMPAEEMLDALLIFVAGAVLLTPGFLTDLFGLYLLFPPTRSRVKRWLTSKIEIQVVQNTPRSEPQVKIVGDDPRDFS